MINSCPWQGNIAWHTSWPVSIVSPHKLSRPDLSRSHTLSAMPSREDKSIRKTLGLVDYALHVLALSCFSENLIELDISRSQLVQDRPWSTVPVAQRKHSTLQSNSWAKLTMYNIQHWSRSTALECDRTGTAMSVIEFIVLKTRFKPPFGGTAQI